MPFDADVVVVGGGPAGSSVALHMAALGARMDRVVVLDRARHPREKPCAGAVSAWGVRALAALGVTVGVPHVPIGALVVRAGCLEGASNAEAEGAIGIVARRDAFDASLLEVAARRGAVVRDGEGVADLVAVPGGWRVHTTRGARLTTRFVAACDGAGSTVRKLLRVPEAARKGHLYVLETEPLAGDAALVRRGACDFDLGPSDRGVPGYYWDFATVMDGAPAVSRGIYDANLAPSPGDGALRKAVLHAMLRTRGVDPTRVRLKPFPTRPLVRGAPLAAAGVLLVGEAAGIDRTTGEGIAQALLMGGIAARHLARAADGAPLDPRAYARDVLEGKVGRHLLQSAWLAERVYGARGAPWRRFLARSPAARAAGARWYAGSPVGRAAKARLGLALAAELARA